MQNDFDIFIRTKIPTWKFCLSSLMLREDVRILRVAVHDIIQIFYSQNSRFLNVMLAKILALHVHYRTASSVLPVYCTFLLTTFWKATSSKLSVLLTTLRMYIRYLFLWHSRYFWSTRTAKSMNWNFPKRSMDLDLSLVLMAKFYSTFSICFVYLIFITRCRP